VKKVTAVLLFAALGAGIPLCSGAQIVENDAGRAAAQKHNEKQSRREVKAHHKALKKAEKRDSTAAKHRKNGVSDAS
jgi:hypothetical protein